MAAIDDLNTAAARLEAAANALGAAASSASETLKGHVEKDSAISQHVSRLNAVATAIGNATAALTSVAKG